MLESKITIPNVGLGEIDDYEPAPDEEQLITNAEIQAEKDILAKTNQAS